MSLRYKGGVISATPPTPTSTSATGVWTLEQQLQAEAAGNWPSQPPAFGEQMRSLRFNSADTTYLARTPASAGNRKTWTISLWIKRSKLGARQDLFVNTNSGGYNGQYFEFFSDDTLQIGDYPTSGGFTWQLKTTQVFRDLSAWYHIVVALDTTQATSSNRVKIYVNGSQVTSFGTANYPTQNLDADWNSTSPARFGYALYNDQAQNGYATEMVFVDGQALTPSSFGQTNSTTGVWEPKAITGLTYGTNGFYLNFQDNSGTTATTLGKDSSGNGNNWTPNNFSVTAGIGNDSMVDTPYPYGTDTGAGGELRGNYCTLNPIGPGAGTIANGSLQFTAQDNYGRLCTFGLSTGKWYWESTATATEYFICGLISQAASYGSLYDGTQASGYNDGGGYPGPCYGINISGGGTSYKVDQTTATTYGPQVAPVNGDVFMFAVDFDAGKFWVGKNGTWMASGDPVAGTNATWSSMTATTYFVGVHGYGTPTQYLNFGQRAFSYTAPSGFKAMCAQNLTAPTVAQGDDYFNTVLYTGNGSTQSITGVGFQPDFIWYKSISNATWNHGLFDVIRGTSKQLFSNTAGAEGTYSGVTAFNSDGFSLGSDNGGNESGGSMVAWNWKGGGTGVSNAQGTITSTVSANTTSGFSVVKYTGNGNDNATVGHGLGVTPSMIIVRRLSGDDWYVHQTSLTSISYGLRLNKTEAESSNTSTVKALSSTTFTLGTDGMVNVASNDYIAYVFASVSGYSAFGKYTGNGSSDGPFVYTGFRPAFVLTKAISSATTGNWRTTDSVRNPYNVADQTLFPNLTNVGNTNNIIDILSNGFKMRQDNTDRNGSGTQYIYIAFAQNPFKYALAR